MARLRATASAARSVLDGCEHDGMLSRVGNRFFQTHKSDHQKAGFKAHQKARSRSYLAAVMDWFARRILAWRLSNTMDASFCIDAVEEALAKYGCPQVFNTDQGSQFTSAEFTGLLISNGIEISMDGKGAWRDNVFVERFWRTIKYEEVYLHAYDSVAEAQHSIGRYLAFYNARRPHTALDHRTPDQAYFDRLPLRTAA